MERFPARAERPLRVLTIVGNAIVGGMETVVLRLTERLPREAFRITLLAPFHGAFTARMAPLVSGVHVAPMGARLHWHTVQLAAGLVRRERIDVIHAHLAPAHVVAALAGRATGIPVLATVHAMHLSLPDLEAHRLGGTHLCVVSDAALAHALAVGVAPDRITCVHNGVDTAVFRPQAPSRRRGPTIGFVGRLSPEKNPAMFVRAAARLHERRPGVRFVMFGAGPLEAELRALVRDVGLAQALRLAGERADMSSAYGELDILALTSWHEGRPLALLEAMACGLPAVATSVGGVPELVAVDETGMLVPPGDDDALAAALERLVEDAPLRRRLGSGARLRAERLFPLACTVEETGRLLRHVAAHAAAPARAPADVRTLPSAATG